MTNLPVETHVGPVGLPAVGDPAGLLMRLDVAA